MTSRDPLAQRLALLGPFAGCSDAELAEVVRRTCSCRVHPGDRLAVEGAAGHEFVVIVEGHADVSVAGELVARLGPGDCFGEVALLDGGARSATVTATTDMVLQVSDRRELQAVLASAPTVGQNLLRTLASRLRAANRSGAQR